MSEQRAGRREKRGDAAAQAPRAAGVACEQRPRDGAATCPGCGAELRLWANYHRCRNCGYKESCCF